MLWSSATLQHWPPRLLSPVLTGVVRGLQADAFEAQHLSTMAWALARLNTNHVARSLEARNLGCFRENLERFIGSVRGIVNDV